MAVHPPRCHVVSQERGRSQTKSLGALVPSQLPSSQPTLSLLGHLLPLLPPAGPKRGRRASERARIFQLYQLALWQISSLHARNGLQEDLARGWLCPKQPVPPPALCLSVGTGCVRQGPRVSLPPLPLNAPIVCAPLEGEKETPSMGWAEQVFQLRAG